MNPSEAHALSRPIGPLLAFLFASLCAVVPILTHIYLPLIDLPNHIARHHIAANGQGALAEYYTYTASLVPNSAVDMIWRALGHPGDPVIFSTYVMAVYGVAFIGATMVLARVVQGVWTVWSAGVALLVFNGPFFWGFQNFVVSVPVCLLGLALWLALENRATALRLAVFVPFALALYLMHFFAFAILCIAVFGREAQVQITRPGALLSRAGKLCLMMLPFLLPVLWLAYGVLTGPESPAGTRTEFGTFEQRFGIVLSPFIAPNTDSVPQINMLGYAAFAFVALCVATLFFRSGPRLVFNRMLLGPVVALALVNVIAPAWLNGVALVHIRIPIVLFALLFAATRWQDLDQRKTASLAIFVVALVAMRSFYVEQLISRHDADIRDVLQATENLPVGARVMPIRAPGLQDDYRLSHAQAYTVTRRDAFVPTLFLGVHAVQLKERWTEFAHPALYAVDVRRILRQETHPVLPGTEFLQDWEQKFTHVLLLDRDTNEIHEDPRLTRVVQSGRATLYEVTAGR